jgi:hypothetical protein
MKQYTDKDQTAKLIELGFPKPNSICLSSDNDVMVRGVYSIGELIEFLEHRIYRMENDMQWLVDGVRVYRADKELINALFDACVTLKEERVI